MADPTKLTDLEVKLFTHIIFTEIASTHQAVFSTFRSAAQEILIDICLESAIDEIQVEISDVDRKRIRQAVEKILF